MPIWLPLLLVACGMIVVFGLLVPRRPIIAGLGIAAVVLVIAAFALMRAHPGRHTAVWPRFARPHVPPAPRPPALAELADLKRHMAEFRRHGDEVIAESMNEAKEAYRQALEEARALSQVVISPGGASVLMVSEDSPSASVSAVISDREKVELKEKVEVKQKVKSLTRVQAYIAPPRDRTTQRGGLLLGLLSAVEIAAFLCVGYIFLDGATRGQFTWPLRIASVAAFAAIYVALAALRHQL